MKTLKLLSIGFLVFGATILAAEMLPARGPLSFSTYDKDNNNVISQKEFNVIKQQRMSQKAQSGNMMRNVGKSANFSDIDTNSDGIITQAELQTHQNKRFTNKVNPKNVNMQGGKGMKMGQGRNW